MDPTLASKRAGTNKWAFTAIYIWIHNVEDRAFHTTRSPWRECNVNDATVSSTFFASSFKGDAEEAQSTFSLDGYTVNKHISSQTTHSFYHSIWTVHIFIDHIDHPFTSLQQPTDFFHILWQRHPSLRCQRPRCKQNIWASRVGQVCMKMHI